MIDAKKRLSFKITLKIFKNKKPLKIYNLLRNTEYRRIYNCPKSKKYYLTVFTNEDEIDLKRI